MEVREGVRNASERDATANQFVGPFGLCSSNQKQPNSFESLCSVLEYCSRLLHRSHRGSPVIANRESLAPCIPCLFVCHSSFDRMTSPRSKRGLLRSSIFPCIKRSRYPLWQPYQALWSFRVHVRVFHAFSMTQTTAVLLLSSHVV